MKRPLADAGSLDLVIRGEPPNIPADDHAPAGEEGLSVRLESHARVAREFDDLGAGCRPEEDDTAGGQVVDGEDVHPALGGDREAPDSPGSEQPPATGIIENLGVGRGGLWRS
jgi:hypothetical protein